ncbi:sialate O-acetylesterase [Flavobacterium ajazii]|uniref:sialate O-acetylesterase n=1 Tax=Flavobacterium ajazii TaxID=2692318 RepID=UPI0013D357E7|nr:sialate O-acetylesterase [Flavobacterium ajazii]
MKKIFKTVLLLLFLNGYSQNTVPEKPLELYLLIGQSNMAGRGALDNQSQLPSEVILMLDKNNDWIPAKDPMHFDKPSAGVGPGISFAQTMLEGKNGVKIGLIPCAWGGSPIKVWKSGAKYFNNFPYDEAISRTKIAMQKGVLKGILWHQGESDNDAVKSQVYLEKLKELVASLRKDLNAPNLPFVAGEIGRFNKEDYINKIINTIPNEIENSAAVSSEGLTDKGDHLHFDSPSARELGKRYAVAMQQLLKETPSLKTSKKKPKVVLTFDDAEISHYNNVAPLLKKYGFGATFFVCEFPFKKPEEKKEYMTWNQIQELYKQDFEIGNHTGHHKNVTKLSPEDINKEIAYVEEKCAEFKIPKPISFAYPGNRYDTISQGILKKRGYKYARAGGSTLYDIAEDSRLAIPSYTVASTDKLEVRVKTALQNLKQGDIIVLTFHGVPDVVHPDYSTSVEFLEELLQYIKEKDFQVVAMRNILTE